MEKVFSEFCCRRKHAVLRSKYSVSKQVAAWPHRCCFINPKSAAGTVVVCDMETKTNIILNFLSTLNHSVCDSATSNNANLFWTLPNIERQMFVLPFKRAPNKIYIHIENASQHKVVFPFKHSTHKSSGRKIVQKFYWFDFLYKTKQNKNTKIYKYQRFFSEHFVTQKKEFFLQIQDIWRFFAIKIFGA